MRLVHSAKVLIVHDDTILVLRTSETHPRHAFMQDLPGGIIEPGELTEAGLIRELQEETSIHVDHKQLTRLYSHTYVFPDNVIYTDDIYTVKLSDKPDVTLSYEHDQYVWISLDDIDNLAKAYQVGVDFIRQHQLLTYS